MCVDIHTVDAAHDANTWPEKEANKNAAKDSCCGQSTNNVCWSSEFAEVASHNSWVDSPN